MGVKSLWSLLSPVGRPVMLETIEGKALAIDSSIWIYQFQATMRDKDGRALVNAHVLGFLRRICKLLFYGIRPVFVFDGGAPALKRNTISERKKKKSGAAVSHVKLAERLLAAQLRREALGHAQANRPPVSKGKGKAPAGSVMINENTVYLEDIDNSVVKTPAKRPENANTNTQSPSSSSKKKGRFHDHDPYRLPEINMDEVIAQATRSSAPDPRLATEEELRAFIEDMRPEDIDVNSPAFRELPTEVQYEIVGDLRLKSRQTSYKRLQNMLQKASTPLDFSKEQIKNLKQRNALTQQLLTTTDSIGKAHITIPVRIASERNREYLLMKNEGEGGGWILGIRDEGTRAKPIEIDQEDHHHRSDESDMEMEEVTIPGRVTADPDLREYQQTMALSAIGKRSSTHITRRPPPKPLQRKTRPKPLFELEDEDDRPQPIEDDEDVQLAMAIQASLEEPTPMNAISHNARFSDDPPQSTELYNYLDDDDLYASPNRLETVLSLAGTNSLRTPSRNFAGHSSEPSLAMFGKPTLLTSEPSESELDDDMEEVVVHATSIAPAAPDVISHSTPAQQSLPITIEEVSESELDDNMEEVVVPATSIVHLEAANIDHHHHHHSIRNDPEPSNHSLTEFIVEEPAALLETQGAEPSTGYTESSSDSDNDSLEQWSRSPSPSFDPTREAREPHVTENWDAAQEMDPHAEEGEFARFISQVKGRDLDAVRLEIDEEIRTLNHQKKAAMRDSEDITQQMISQIMLLLRLFGIPYITAPMEAEAQCAELVSLGLVDGIITDDSDVFLFGGQRVFKNMFNQSKTVECFLLSDLGRELGLERGTLIRLAYLLGSDYVEGLSGVGPVVAMELLKEFPGEDGLHKFKDWWLKVQSGRDKDEENKSKFRKRFKKKYKDLYLPQEWPNAAVRDAYYHPTVDSSEEPFKWGLPDLDALRDFLREELGWGQSKVDDLLLPIIQKMNKRKQATSLNRQGNLNNFLDVAPGSHAPRKRQAYASKRLQQVVSEFRSEQAKLKGKQPTSEEDKSESDVAEDVPPKKKERQGYKEQEEKVGPKRP
ncbi:hypothetical protein SERLA73DRAFT_108084 [Serpula lacrymans var. lacrymans S7.3]|uniref:PIN domain-like protein n=2 Tax=Serpula lacrymans var. lacrymans TaxID=341189 RepID=F8PYD0_SERL3|nr:hypothetical protein SERLA73DRAFT_108084 [Serpula lacrymans var. lacrymans S7.3]